MPFRAPFQRVQLGLPEGRRAALSHEGLDVVEQIIAGIRPGQSVGIFIGPEGGFDESEIDQAKETGAIPITLGKRILRTETAGLTTLSILMYHLECREQLEDKNIK